MIDFNEKPITAEVRALVHEIVDRFLDYNPTSTKQETTGDKPTFFLNFEGTICTLAVRTYADGYIYTSECEYLTEVQGDKLNRKDTLTHLQGILKRMEEIYANWEKKEQSNV